MPFAAINDAKRPVLSARFGKPGHTNATLAACRNGENVVVHGVSRMVLKMINLLGVENQPELAR